MSLGEQPSHERPRKSVGKVSSVLIFALLGIESLLGGGEKNNGLSFFIPPAITTPAPDSTSLPAAKVLVEFKHQEPNLGFSGPVTSQPACNEEIGKLPSSTPPLTATATPEPEIIPVSTQNEILGGLVLIGVLGASWVLLVLGKGTAMTQR